MNFGVPTNITRFDPIESLNRGEFNTKAIKSDDELDDEDNDLISFR